jgi:two-component system, chemotaxis family, CheB/CheR fusion protein
MSAASSAHEQDAIFEALLEYLKRTRGFDFTGYKRSGLRRRVTRRLQILRLESLNDYLDYLEVHPEEFTHLFNTILINVTAFFREPASWDFLVQEIIPRIVANKSAADPIRIWSAGCASGEEACTLAMVFAEALGMQDFRQRVKIYATDVDEEALTAARHARYGANAIKSIPAELREKYFDEVGMHHVFNAELRRAMIFGRHDLVQDAPISRLDLLVCRNTLMYFNAETQSRILSRFHYALNETGLLFLGKAEMLLTHSNLFTPNDLKHRIFTKVPRRTLRDRLLLLAQAGDTESNNYVLRQVRLRDLAFDTASEAVVVVDVEGNLALANERARTMFTLNRRDIGRSFQELELSYRPVELRSRIEQVYAERLPLRLANVERYFAGGDVQYLDVQILPLLDSDDRTLGVSISFTDVTRYHRLQTELERSKQELETAFEELQSTNEELETTNEELQSTVEELETTNEELQSTNEELETMNEELQSSNEELQALNDELRRRTDQFDQANAFLHAILASLNAAAVVVDRQLAILIWNHRAEALWGLRAGEVQGRSLPNLDMGLPVGQLVGPMQTILRGDAEDQEIMLTATNRRGRTIQCQVACTPVRRPGGDIQGVILFMEERGGARRPSDNA